MVTPGLQKKETWGTHIYAYIHNYICDKLIGGG